MPIAQNSWPTRRTADLTVPGSSRLGADSQRLRGLDQVKIGRSTLAHLMHAWIYGLIIFPYLQVGFEE